MKLTDITLTIVEHPDGVCIAWMESFPGLIVQVDDKWEVPREIAKSLEVMLRYGFDQGAHTIYNVDDFFNTLDS